MSKKIEQVIQGNKDRYCDNRTVNGEELYKRVMVEKYSTIPAVKPAVLPMFNLPYYEGLNSYNGKYWLGIYRRDEWFTIEFLKDICRLCLQLKIGQIGASPWKSLIIKGIEEKDRKLWNHILSKYQINIRHAANELNFQVEDNCKEGLSLKNFLVKHLNNNDVRTFGICIGIKTRKKSEVFSSILVRRRPLLSFGSKGIIYVYDIMCAKDFNPNERTGAVISSGNPKFLVPEQLRRAILKFYEHQAQVSQVKDRQEVPRPNQELPQQKAGYYQCRHCQTIYDEEAGEPTNGIPPGTLFESLPETYSCSLCEAGKQDFIKVNRMLAEERVA
jgi:rubredoxin